MLKQTNSSNQILSVENLKVHFPITGGLIKKTLGHVRAVDEVSFGLAAGETLSLVGESGCGKTTAGRALMRLVEPTDGIVDYVMRDNSHINIPKASNDELDLVRQEMQIIFQDPFASLNPRMTIFDIVADPLRVNGLASGSELEDRVAEMMRVVGLSTSYMRRYPHAFSGGQRQRLGIARTLVMNQRMIIASEHVYA